jgi:hypothetical protein
MADFLNNSIKGFQELQNQIKSVKKELIEITKLTKKSTEGINPAEAKAEDIQKLDTATKALIETEKQLVKLTAEEIKFAKKIADAKSREGKIRAENKLILAEQVKANKEEAKEALGLTSAYAKQSKQLRDLKNKYKNLSLGTAEQRKQAQKLLPAITKLDAKLKAVDKSVGDNFRNVGNYSGAIQSLTPVLGTFGSKINSVQMGLTSLKEGFNKMVPAQKGAAKGSRILGAAMKGIPILAIVGAITALVGAFASTQRGANALRKVIEPIKAIFDAFLGVVQDLSFKAFDKLKEAIDNPKQAFIDLGKVIVDNVINRFKAFFVLGDSLSALFRGDLKEALKLGADGLVQLSTGITDATDKVGSAVSKVVEIVEEASDIGSQIAEILEEIERRERDIVLPVAKARLEYQKLKEIANDQLKTDEERIEALKKAEEQQRFIAKEEGKLLDLRIEALKLQQSTSDTSFAEQKELQELIAEKLKFEEQAQKKISGLVSLRTGIELRALKRILAARQKNIEREIELYGERTDLLVELEEVRYEKELELAIKNKEDLELLEQVHQKRLREIRDKEEKEQIKSLLDEWEAQKKLNQDIEKLFIESAVEEEIFDDKVLRDKVEKRKEAEEQQSKDAFKFAQDLTKSLGEELNVRNQQQIDSLNREEQEAKAAIDVQKQLAAKGLENTLAFEQERADKIALQRKEALEKQQKQEEAIKLAEAFISAFEARVQDNPDTAIALATKDVLLARGVAKALATAVTGFADGGYTGDGGKYEEAGVVHKGEFVIDKETTGALGLRGADMGDFKSMIAMNGLSKSDARVITSDNTQVVSELRNLNETIKSKPVQQIDIDKLGNIIEIVDNGRIKQITKLKTRGRL